MDKLVDIFVPDFDLIWWEQLNDSLKSRLREVHFTTWQRQVKPKTLDDSTLTVQIPNKFIRDWIQDHFQQDIESAIHDVHGVRPRLVFEINEAMELPAPEVEASPNNDESPARKELTLQAPAPQPQPNSGGFVLNNRYTFDSFVVGPSNQFAHAASRAVAEGPGKNYNPLFLYGGVGLGKTHLLNAVGHEIKRRNPAARIAYVSSEQFINKLVHSIRFDRMTQFRNMFRDNCDLLLIDDIQFIAGKERTQEEFFHTFDRLYNSGKQIILSSDRSPNDIPGLEERLRSRFQWGLIADVQIPDQETRVAIVKKKADTNNIVLPDDVAYFLASSIRSNIRELEGSLVRLSAFASLLGQTMTVDLAKEVLQSILAANQSQLTISRIQKTVADFYQVRLNDLLGRRRTRSLALPRQIAMYLCRKHVQASFPEIGNKFGGKDHSTVVHACSKITNCLEEDEQLKRQIGQLEQQLNVQ